MMMTFRTTTLAALLGATTMTAQAGVLTLDGVTFTSNWSGNVLTLEIDAAGHTGGWSGATGLAALAIKGIGTYDNVSVGGAPGGTTAWHLSTSELKASGCSGTGNGAPGSRMCFYGQQIALADNMVFAFTFNGAGVTTSEPHVKVEFVDAKGNKVGSLLSQTLPASTTTPVAPSAPPALPATAPTGTTGGAMADTDDTVDVTFDAGMTTPSGAPAGMPPAQDLPSTLPSTAVDSAQTAADSGAGTTAVPEPQSIALLLGGLGLMGLVLRRRARAH